MGKREYTDSELLNILKRSIQRHGELSKVEFNRIANEEGLPTYYTYYNRFGGWEIAKKLALSANEVDDELSNLEKEVLRLVEKEETLEMVCNSLDRSPLTVRETIRSLNEKGYAVNVEEGERVTLSKVPHPFKKISIERFYGGKAKIGLIGDTQLGSQYARLDVLNALYDLFEAEGVTKVFHAGDLLDGDHVYSGQEYELLHVGADKQVVHAIDNYPKRDKLKTYFITGNHDLVYFKKTGYDVGKGLLTKEREDMIYLGPEEADFHLYAEGEEEKSTPVILRIFHPGGTGSAYALSYRAQKTIESYGGGEKPSILAIGHLHKASYFFIRNVHTIQVGCTQDQTRFMRNRAIQAHVGGFIVEFTIEDDGTITRFKNEFIPFYGG